MALRDWLRKIQTGGVPVSPAIRDTSVDRTGLHVGSYSFAIPRHTATLLYTSEDKPCLDDFRMGGAMVITLNVSTGATSYEERKHTAERSTVFVNLPVSQPRDPSLVEKPDYWPAYVWLAQEQRWIYLNWLQNVSDDVDLGYVFLYFYGLERRMLTKDFEQAFHEAVLLRQHHAKGSFPEFAEQSVLAACTIQNNGDFAREYLKRFPCAYLNNLSLLAMSRLGIGLSAEQLISSKHLYGDGAKKIKRTYLTSHPTLYRACLSEVLQARFGRTDMPFADILETVDIPKTPESLFANPSVHALLQPVDMLNIVACTQFQDRISSVLMETHETVKERLALSRKDKTGGTSVPRFVEPMLDTPTTTCPACGAHFTHTPASGRKCPSCGVVLRLRTDPKTRVRSLMTEEQAAACDARWNEYRERAFIERMAAGVNVKYADVCAARDRLSKNKGIQACYSDVLVLLYESKMRKNAEEMSYGLWRNGYYSVSELYRSEQQFEKQLEALLTVCYIDANGPNNTTPSMVSQFPPFSPPRSLIGCAPGIILQINQLLRPLAMNDDAERELFLRSAASVRNRYMSVAPETAWNMLLEAQADSEDSTIKS